MQSFPHYISFIRFHKIPFSIFILVCVSLLLYCLNLENTYWFAADSARDTLAALRILKNKELTLIGPPLSFGQYGIREVYFGSLSYYLGVLGLLFSGGSVLGPVIINSVLMALGIPFMYLLSFRITRKTHISLLATAFYALSPTIVAHMRFYWNPNFLIPLSAPLFFSALIALDVSESNTKRLLAAFTFGLLSAAAFNLHYFSVIALIPATICVLRIRKKHMLGYICGGVLGLLPLLVFELKHKGYLLQATIYNLQHPIADSATRSVLLKISDALRLFGLLHGIDSEAIRIPILMVLPIVFSMGVGVTMFVCGRKSARKYMHHHYHLIVITMLLTALTTAILSREQLYIRYAFLILPFIALWSATTLFSHRALWIGVLLLELIVSIRLMVIPISGCGPTCHMPTITAIEKASRAIIKDKPKAPFNISENFTGDARATYLRFFLERDAPIVPEADTSYGNLSVLYVFSPSLQKTRKENRWEYYATPNLHLSQTFEIERDVYVFKFSK